MAVTADKAAPYAPASTMLEILKRHRDRGLPLPVNKETLVRGGVAETIIPRVLQALQTLDLIDDAGQPTPTFEGLRKAPEAEYKSRMAEWLNAAYADALQFVDPATADETKVRDAFRNYVPTGQQARMVSLFIQLYAAAGIGAEKASAPRAPRPQRAAPATRHTVARSVPLSANLKAAMASRVGRPMQHGTDIPEPIMGMLTRLPPAGGWWTQEQRDKFLNTFGTVLDFCFPTVAPNPPDEENEDLA